MNTLESKRKALEVRLADLARGFEEATIDKNEQEEKTVKMRKILDTAAQLRRILRGERQRCQQEGCAMAAGFATYLGPYHHNFRRVMLTVHWPNCLRERGIPLVIDSVDVLRGRVIDWSINFLKTASGASSVYEVDFTSLLQSDVAAAANAAEKMKGNSPHQLQVERISRPVNRAAKPTAAHRAKGIRMLLPPSPVRALKEETRQKGAKEEGAEKTDEEKPVTEGEGAPPRTPKSPKTGETGAPTPPRTPKENAEARQQTPPKTPKDEQAGGDAGEEDPLPRTPKGEAEGRADATLSQIPEEDLDEDDMATSATCGSLIKLLVGDTTLNEWIRKDFGPRQIENAAILSSSWQRPPMLIDPNGEGLVWLGRLNKLLNRPQAGSTGHGKQLMSFPHLLCLPPSLIVTCHPASITLRNPHPHHQLQRTDPHIILGMERAITKGKPVILKNCEEVIDNFITPLIHHRNTTNVKDTEEEPRMIMFCGRRTLCHQDFRFYLSTILPKPRFSSAITSTTTLINFGVSNDTLIEDLLSRIFARIRPELYQERISGLRNLQLLKDTLFQFSHVLTNRMLTGVPKALQFITNITEARLQLANELSKTQNILNDLDVLKDELYPVARRGALLFALMRSLSSVRHEYQFTLNFFLQLFDEAVGGELPADFGHGPDEEDGYEEEESLSEGKKQPPRPGSLTSQLSTTEQAGRESGDKQEEKQEGEGIPPIAEEESTQQTQPEGTEAESTSASTGAAHKLVYGSESEELPSVELPDTITLPTQGVEYTSLSVNRIKQLMDSVTSLVFHRIRQSLLEEDHLLFRTLLCLNIQCEAGEDFSSEEMSLFLQGNPGLGMQLTLSDFDSKDSPPTWLPREKWDDIMALSVLPGPLDSLCVSFAAASDAWHDWYKSPYPEQEPLPLAESEAIEAQKKKVPEGTRGSPRQSAVGSPDLGPLNDFHQLLILRMLRPDRLPTALARYTDKHLNLNDPNEDSMNIAEVLLDARSHLGILMLLPTNTGSPDMVPESRLKLVSNPVDVLIGIAKAVNINVERVMFGDGCEFTVEEAIHSADKNDTWIVVEGLHLAPTPFFTTLRQQLQRIFKSRANMTDEQHDASRFCVWLTCETDSGVPDQLIQCLHKVSWTHVMSLAKPYPAPQDGPAQPVVEGALASYVSPQKYLREAIVTALRQVPYELWEELSKESNLVKGLSFGMAVIQGVLVARQLFGSAGLTRWYPFGLMQIVNAIWFVIGTPLQSQEGGEPSLDDLCYCVGQLLFGSMMSNESDLTYVTALVREVLESVYRDPAAEILLGTELISTPQANVAPTEYADWFENSAGENITLGALQLHTSIEHQANDASAHRFISNMYRMHETQNMEVGDSLPQSTSSVDINKLRSALDICLEKIPILLELGQVPQLMTQEFNFPYHRPSIISMSSAASDLMPESIGYVLLQECLWMNSLLCYIRQQISDLQTSMLGGPTALPQPLLPTVYSLQEELVPIAWTHPNGQPCTHSLSSWLDDLVLRHKQLHGWVKRRMVPTFDENGEIASQGIARGRLTSVWLGGLVEFRCVVLNSQDVAEFDVDEGGLFINNMYLQGADWDFDQDTLTESKSALFHIPCLYLCPTVKPKPKLRSAEDREDEPADAAGDSQPAAGDNTTGENTTGENTTGDNTAGDDTATGEKSAGNTARGDTDAGDGENAAEQPAAGEQAAENKPPSPAKEQEEGEQPSGANERDEQPQTIYQCPVYMNKSRQILVCKLPINCPAPEEKWILSNTAFILDRGLPEGASKKSRSYLLLQRLPPTQRPETGSEISARSQQSQLSYKAMTPQAPPLPPGLGLTREPPMINGKPGHAGDAVEPPLVQSRPTSATQGSHPGSASRAPRPPSQASRHSRGHESETGQEAITEEKEPTTQVEADGKDATRGEEPEIEQLDRQGEMQRGVDLVLDASKENQEEEKEKDETEVDGKRVTSASRHTSTPPTDAGAGHQSRSHTPHPSEIAPRGASAASRESAARAEARGEDEIKRSTPEDIKAIPPVTEDNAGRGGQKESEEEPAAAEPTSAERSSPQQGDRAEDTLHYEADMKSSRPTSKQATQDAKPGSRPPTQPRSRPPTQEATKPRSRPPTQGSKGGDSRPPTQGKK
ncbi:hypothetical protein BaRGS_00029144 [Batillaria attramentaria]|uniref:Uncharacterized protein n=1 Tax=Batillaria attramentaria TaxID=370345 RepID=A0ABD0JY11_9CAEN